VHVDHAVVERHDLVAHVVHERRRGRQLQNAGVGAAVAAGDGDALPLVRVGDLGDVDRHDEALAEHPPAQLATQRTLVEDQRRAAPLDLLRAGSVHRISGQAKVAVGEQLQLAELGVDPGLQAAVGQRPALVVVAQQLQVGLELADLGADEVVDELQRILVEEGRGSPLKGVGAAFLEVLAGVDHARDGVGRLEFVEQLVDVIEGQRVLGG
jgi:hypothetical protein